VEKPIEFFSYIPKQIKDLVGEWFANKFELPVKLVQRVNKSVLN
jgi:hypothetical protein